MRMSLLGIESYNEPGFFGVSSERHVEGASLSPKKLDYCDCIGW